MRILSFLIALAVAASVILYPRAVASDMTDVPHGWLVLLLIGMSLCFVHGVGFKTNSRILNIIFLRWWRGPVWPLQDTSSSVRDLCSAN